MVEVNIESEPIYKKAYHLPIETCIYVPSTNKLQQRISPEEMKKRLFEVRRFLAKTYGGFTSVPALGGYFMQDGKKVVEEDVIKVTSFSTIEKYKKNKDRIRKMLKTWGNRWGQESMGYEFEGDMYYV
jgi:hypothetical protein